uniref:cytochrome c-type biogenesis protein n=3 Tax=Pseudomonas TaxID=286 RepID=UPI0010696931
ELRCPKCQNQNIADSNAPIATDLRREIFRMLEEGKSNAEIVDFLVLRYGDFVLYKPPVDTRTYLLWYGPFALLGLGALGLVVLVLRRRKVENNPAQVALSASENQRLQTLLQQNSQDPK